MDFFVVSTHFTLLEAFKRECEKMGWCYDDSFNRFLSNRVGPGKGATGLYFDNTWLTQNGTPKFSLSNSDERVFELPKQWDRALEFAQKTYDKSVVEISENDIRNKFNIDKKSKIRIVK